MYGSHGDVAFGWGEDKAAAANKTPIAQAKKYRKKERKKQRKGCAHIHDEVAGGVHSAGVLCWHGF